MLGMAEAASKKSVIREVSGISKCYPIANETDNDNSVSYVFFYWSLIIIIVRFELITHI
jgi:hypothetical protein